MSEKYQNKYRIPSARLQGYDYGQNGAYFITICTKNRIHYFGEIISSFDSETQNIAFDSETQNIASLQGTSIGIIANEYWSKIQGHFPFVILDEFVVMPNHVHGILVISKETHNDASLQEIGYANKFGPQSGNISSVIRGYKAALKSFATTNKIEFAWQSRFYDRIIRDEDEMKRIRKYIVENPDNWFRDSNNKEDLYM
jgi:putative transposase